MIITEQLKKANVFWFSLYAAGTAFCLYTCVYAFRKAFAVATFENLFYLGISFKVWLIMAQVAGYALSKFIGIKVVSELTESSRKASLVSMVALAGISLLLFPLIPRPYNILVLFTNGLSLGMIWGIIFHYLEGRKNTELLGAGLSISFIFSSGFVKTIGASVLLYWNVSEWWMPFVTACLFIPPLALFVWLLDQLPPPSVEDENLRTKRIPMNGKDRYHFLSAFGPGLVLLILVYSLLTSYREFRDNFSAEIWRSLGFGGSPEMFTLTEIPIAIVVLIVMGSVMFIRKNYHALLINHLLVLGGLLLIGLSTFLFQLSLLNGTYWMILIGLGLYLGYVPFNSIFFDRLLAAFRYTGTVGFAMYLADSFGYLGGVGILLFKEFGFHSSSWTGFFISGGYVVTLLGSICIILSMLYFHRKHLKYHQSSSSTFNTSGTLLIR
jgi:MFS family permease